jgi:hypothetical protein
MKIFKELNKLGYIHYSATTIEELDDLPLNSAERVSEQALVLRWFREKYNLASHIATYWQHDWNNYSYQYYFVEDKIEWNGIEHYKTYEEAELACLEKLIEIVKNK